MRYGDLNPVRAKLVRSAGHWRWSSHRHYAYGEPNDLVTDAPEYLALGRTAPHRRKAYLHLFAQPLLAPYLYRRSSPESCVTRTMGEAPRTASVTSRLLVQQG